MHRHGLDAEQVTLCSYTLHSMRRCPKAKGVAFAYSVGFHSYLVMHRRCNSARASTIRESKRHNQDLPGHYFLGLLPHAQERNMHAPSPPLPKGVLDDHTCRGQGTRSKSVRSTV